MIYYHRRRFISLFALIIVFLGILLLAPLASYAADRHDDGDIFIRAQIEAVEQSLKRYVIAPQKYAASSSASLESIKSFQFKLAVELRVKLDIALTFGISLNKLYQDVSQLLMTPRKDSLLDKELIFSLDPLRSADDINVAQCWLKTEFDHRNRERNRDPRDEWNSPNDLNCN